MKVATWNVNSINMRKVPLLKWLSEVKPHVVLLQETKCVETNFPKAEIEELGYNVAVLGQKAYNGVAVLSLAPIDEVITSFHDNPVSKEARYLEAVISIPKTGKAMRVISVYVPNGAGEDDTRFKIKLKFMDALRAHLKKLLKGDEMVVIGGDFNAAPEDIDTYDVEETKDTVLCDIEVKKRLRAIINLGYYDSFRTAHPDKVEYTWWDYRGSSWYRNKGLRLDHILLSPEACDVLKDVKIERKLREQIKPSDHVPVIITLGA